MSVNSRARVIPNLVEFTQNAARNAAINIRGSFRSSIGNSKEDSVTRIPLRDFIRDIKSHLMFNSSYFNSWRPNRNINITNVQFPRFSRGRNFYTALMSTTDADGNPLGLFMDGIPLTQGCGTAHFRTG